MKRWGTVFATLGLFAYPVPAAADSAACMGAAERGQKERASGKLIDAQRDFLVCAAAECPSVVAKDCASWSAEVTNALPSIVIDAKDGSGQDVGDATLTIDGNVVAKQLDGKAIPVNPGGHTLEVAANAGPARKASQKFIAKEGEKARSLHFVLAGGATPAGSDKSDGHTFLPWVVVGVGTALAVTGAVLFVTAKTPDNCSDVDNTCRQVPGRSDAALAQDQADAGSAHGRRVGGIIGIIGGGIVAAGGLVWHFLEKPATTAALRPWVDVRGGGGAMMRGTF